MTPFTNIHTLQKSIVLLTAVCLFSSLVGCNNPSAPPTTGTNPPAPNSSRPVSFMVFGDPAELKAYQSLVSAFETENPGAKIELIHVPSQSDYRKRLGTDFAAGTPADVVLMNYRRYASFAAKGVLEPLGSYLSKSTLIKEGDFYQEAIEPFRWKGELMGIPQNLSSLVVYYNKNLFEQAKVPLPKNDWTWDDFLRTAQALTKDTDGDGKNDQYGLGTEVSLQRLAPFVWQNGGLLVDNQTAPTTLALDTPEAWEALQWFVDLRLKHKVVPDAAEEKSEDSESRFQNGRTAMFLNSRRGTPTYREIKGFDWDVAPLPKRKRAAGILHADAYMMPKSCPNKEAAWKFIEFANSEEGQKIVAASGRTVPSLQSVAKSPAFLDPAVKPKNSQVFLSTLPDLRAVPVHSHWVDVEETVSNELERAFYGTASVDEVRNAMISRTKEHFTAE